MLNRIIKRIPVAILICFIIMCSAAIVHAAETSPIQTGSEEDRESSDADPSPVPVPDAKTVFRPGGASMISGRLRTDKVFTSELYRANEMYEVVEKLAEAKTDGTITSMGGLAYMFGDVELDKAGTYYFVVKEKGDDEGEGFTFDTTEYHVSVKVAEQGSSLCVSEFTVSKDTAIQGTFSFSIESGPSFKVTGNRLSDSLKGETYELYGPAAKKDDLVDSKTGTLKFTAGAPTSGKVETIGNENTFSVQKNYTANGSTVYFALVKEGSKIPETVIELVTGSAGNPASATWSLAGCGCNFTNKYKAASIKETIKVNKVVKGNPDNEETFRFVMKRTNGKKVSELSIKGSGEQTFPKTLTFSKTGTYTYVITETAGSNKNMSYDKSSYKVVFKVTDDGKGRLIAKRTITKDSVSASEVVFTNIYTKYKIKEYKNLSLSITNDLATVKKAKSKSVKKIIIPATIKVDGKIIPVTAIAPNAFKNMSKLTTVTIGKNVKSIGKNAFSGCNKLKDVTIKTTKLTLQRIGANAFKNISKKAVIKSPKTKRKAYKKILLKKGMKKTMTFK